ncbi:hypothetical protein TVAG_101230 [Trichomonas vaginalis G3]|uniref:Uncharacterized protein n=1 Tax=Trichomonas vaginalis (strain ATCC PRA-98 / G3) TaxID=412133 RepID=A2DJK5_TRIV3|nr:hypothetical protein TVAGG3_1035920 [Trichomonas vaginalis G3]EAY19405.1 hypothetical protein TVAG_101230 [Trichomonas vaginalis G3]KAI5493197.1 hypothetical protein TVAGG3_1035920 [Trichomonas vaginalis G3]|eukprot:XP_001580391.1 hypothetical protein [Trichomonas vaginalis G3]
MPPAVDYNLLVSQPAVKRFIDERQATLEVYSSDIVGDTSAPCTTFAIISGSNFPQEMVEGLSNLTFDLPFGGQVHPQVEFAPITSKVDRNKRVNKNLPSIEADPEFTAFAASYKEKMKIPTDKLFDLEKVEDVQESNSKAIIKQFNIKFTDHKYKNDQAPNAEPPKKKKKNKKKNKKNKNPAQPN